MLAQIVTTVLGFFLLVAVLRRFFWRTILRMLDERRQRIEEAFRQLASAKEDAVRLQADYGQRLARIEDEARGRLQQAILEGKRIAMEIQEEARTQGAVLVNKSKEAVALELAKAKVTLRDELAAMTMAAIERILRERLDAERDRRLVEETLDELERG
ncbi:MAG: F0F1 ATP synthase subunit B [Candidatus Omnitrophica bacterium]|nr:F0F1 ATP synthase subunit B [Candidatus Omnitrophota bacterium]